MLLNNNSNIPYLALGCELAGESMSRVELFLIERVIESVGYLVAASGPSIITAFAMVFPHH